MNRELLLQHFDRISETPDSIPRLRRFILDLAVRGKLVEQDPSDEPAAELLKRIQAEKARLVKEGKIKEQKELTKNTTEFPYKLPVSWQWVPLGITVNSHLGGGTPSKNNSSYWDGDIFWASVKDIGKGKYVDETIDKISNAGLKDSSSNLIPPGNLIVVTRMGLGKISINRVPIAINQDLRALSLSSHSSIDYFYNFFKTHGYEGSGLTVKGIRVEELLNTNFPLPPLAEQYRIVAKVDELMVLCDQLEAERKKRDTRRDRLVASSLNRISTTSAEEAKDATRFHLNHLPRLTTRTEHIKQLRQTILNLAVRGRLVPQDPNDEPAAELLKRVELERKELVSSGRIRKEKPLSPISTDKSPFVISDTWKWAKIGNAALFTEYGTSQQSHHTESGVPVLKMGDIQDGKLLLGGQKKVPLTIDDLPALYLNKYDLLYNRTNSAELVGKTGLYLGNDNEYTFASYLIRVRCSKTSMNPVYFNLAMNAPYFRETQINPQLKQQCGQANVNGTILKNMLVPIPPLAEQHRIVAKVDELIALCDQLEARLTTTEADSRRLLEAVLRDALNTSTMVS